MCFFPLGFHGGMWNLTVLISDHCLSFTLPSYGFHNSFFDHTLLLIIVIVIIFFCFYGTDSDKLFDCGLCLPFVDVSKCIFHLTLLVFNVILFSHFYITLSRFITVGKTTSLSDVRFFVNKSYNIGIFTSVASLSGFCHKM